MATRALHHPAPLDMILAALPGLPRAVLAHLAARMIERLDEIDGDADLETSGDDDTGNAEDEIYTGNRDFLPRGPGCAISDDDHTWGVAR